MSTNHTKSYGLCQWEADDQVLRTDFNADNAAIDAALAAHDAALAQRGNCRVWTTSYSGNGLSSPANPRSLTFPKRPLLALILGGGALLPLAPGVSKSPSISESNTLGIDMSWSGNTVSLYSATDWAMMNKSGTTYHVIAFMLP